MPLLREEDKFLVDIVDHEEVDMVREGCRAAGVWRVSEVRGLDGAELREVAQSGGALERLVGRGKSGAKWGKVVRRVTRARGGFVVSMRPVYDPVALCFTKYMYIWLQSLIDSGHSYDCHFPLGAEARVELQVWIDYAVAWSRKALWRSAGTVWVAAQDASDIVGGGWFGLYSGGAPVRVGKRTRKGEYMLSRHTV